jgi:hypothetical protein
LLRFYVVQAPSFALWSPRLCAMIAPERGDERGLAMTLRKLSAISTLAVAFALSAAAAAAAPVCLDTTRILETKVNKDQTAIDFHMRDGTVWRNTLRNRCRDLYWYGFAYMPNGGDHTVCENLQAIQVIETHQTCLLGPFAKIYDPWTQPQHS